MHIFPFHHRARSYEERQEYMSNNADDKWEDPSYSLFRQFLLQHGTMPPSRNTATMATPVSEMARRCPTVQPATGEATGR